MGGKKLPTKKEKEAGAKVSKNQKEARQHEDAEWKAAGEGAKSKAQTSRDKAAVQKQEQDTKRAEAKRLAAEEEKEMAKLGKKGTAKAPAAPKVTSFQLQKEKEKEKAAREVAQKTAPDRSVTEESYGTLVDAENVNRTGDGMAARDVDSAIAALSISGRTEVDAHPERRQKAAHLAFEETEVARLREEKPGLRSSQYKELAFKNWQKSPLNPRVQAAAAAAAAQQ